MQLVYAPLFLIFDDWQLVRFLGAIILQAVYILSYAFLIHEAGLSKQVFYLSAALLLLPVSVSYGRIVLYHCHYLPNISLSFLILGLVFGITSKTNWKQPSSFFRFFALIFFSFLGGLNSIRQLMITHAPMLLSIIVFCFTEDHHSQDTAAPALFQRNNLHLLLVAGLAAFSSFLGLKINTNILSKYYSIYINPSENALGFVDASKISNIVYGFFHQFGFRSNVELLSLSGILGLGGIIVGVYCLIISIQKIIKFRGGDNIPTAILQSFFLYYTAVTIIIFAVTKGDYYYTLYLSLCLPWVAPLLITNLEDINIQISLFHAKKIFAWVSVLILFLSGYANVTYFNGLKTFDQVYEGLKFQNKDKKAEMKNVIAYLSDNNYDIGYAEYWEANILTEITNGEISMISIDSSFDEKNLWYADFLTSRYLREAPCEKPFLLLPVGTIKYWEESDSLSYCTLVYEDAFSCIYDIDDLDSFIVTLRY